jgi:hypothetical protein
MGVSGKLTSLKWSCATGADVYEGSGWIQAEFLEGKVHGKVEVLNFKHGGGETKFHVKGTLEYEHNEYFKGTLGIEIDESLDPVLSGKLVLDGFEIYPGRTLYDKTFVIVPAVKFKIWEIGQFAAGCNAMLKVALRPLVLNGFAEVKDFHVAPGKMKVPKFKAGLSVSTGVDLKASLEPYISAGLGLGPLSAGFKLKGRASLNVPVEITAGVGLQGDGEHLGGDVSLGATVRPSIELGFQPVLFAVVEGWDSIEHELCDEVVYTFPDIFVFEWSAKSTFGDLGAQESGAGAAAETVATEEAHQEEEAAKEPPSDSGGAVNDPSTKEGQAKFKKAPDGKDKKDGEASEMEQKLKDIQEIAKTSARWPAHQLVMDVFEWAQKLSSLPGITSSSPLSSSSSIGAGWIR